MDSLNITNDGDDVSGELLDNDENNETVDDRDAKKSQEAKENGKSSQGKIKNDVVLAKHEKSEVEHDGNYSEFKKFTGISCLS